MTDTTSDLIIRLVIALVVLCVMIAAAFWVVSKFFDDHDRDDEDDEPMLSNLEEMLAQGDISPEEFRRISDSARQLQDAGAESVTSPSRDAPDKITDE